MPKQRQTITINKLKNNFQRAIIKSELPTTRSTLEI